jgi:putative PEP-CTERM system TPR-repeat lipoprotein
LSELELLAESSDQHHADYALISARLQLKDPAGALKAVEQLIGKAPSAPVPHHLKGQMLGRKGDLAGARKSFEKAVAVDPKFYPAVAALVALDLADKKQDAAIERLEKHLQREPRTYLALLALYQLRQASGAKPEAQRALLDGAVRANPADPAPRLMLVDHLLARQDVAGAKSAAQEGLAIAKDHPGLINALGRAQFQAGEYQQAVSSFAKIAAAQPESASAHFRLAEAQAGNKDFAAAERSLRRVLEINPTALEAQRGLIQMAAKDKRFDMGLELARTVQKQRPTASVGYLFEGELHASQRKFDPALAAYRNALAREKSPLTAIRIYALLTESGKQSDAIGFGKAWVRDHPKDTIFVAFLGTEAAKANDLAAAEGHFRTVLASQPENPSALNNLAWITSQLGKPGALEMAQRAQKLAPEDPAVLDTLASIHAKEGRVAEALRFQSLALAKAPEAAQPRYRLNLAKLQVQSGDRAAARAELDKLAYLGDKFDGQTEVAELLRKLK